MNVAFYYKSCLSVYAPCVTSRVLLYNMYVCLFTALSIAHLCLFVCGGAGTEFAVRIVLNIRHNGCFPDGILNCITLEFKLHNS